MKQSELVFARRRIKVCDSQEAVCGSHSLVIGQLVEELVDMADADERVGVQVRQDVQQDLWRKPEDGRERKKRGFTLKYHY